MPETLALLSFRPQSILDLICLAKHNNQETLVNSVKDSEES